MGNRVLGRPIGELGSVLVEEWKQLPITECGERLVPLGAFSDYPQIATDSIYFGERNSSPYDTGEFKGALLTVFVREGVAQRLAKVSSLLPSEYMLLVWDAYRPLTVQRSLFDHYVRVLENRGVSHEQAVVDAQRFVSIPSDYPFNPPPHNTGGAVDLTIIRFPEKEWRDMERLTGIVRMPEASEDWQQHTYTAEMERQRLIRESSMPLEMGTVFDGVHPETATRFYEELDPAQLGDKERQCLNNRRWLWNAMVEAGFSNYSEEWWHFDFGNQFDAARTGWPAVYGTAELSKENEVWEIMRRKHYFGYVAIYPFVCDITARTGDLKHTTHPQAERI
jgi:D-alanyl-D-alanine dipeptidase